MRINKDGRGNYFSEEQEKEKKKKRGGSMRRRKRRRREIAMINIRIKIIEREQEKMNTNKRTMKQE